RKLHARRPVRRAPAVATQYPPTTSRYESWPDLSALRLPGDTAAHLRHRVIKGARRLNTLRSHEDHSLGPATSLRCCFTHPCLEKPLRLQTVQGCIKRAYGAAAFSCGLNLLPDRCAVCVLAQSHGCGEQQILELA